MKKPIQWKKILLTVLGVAAFYAACGGLGALLGTYVAKTVETDAAAFGLVALAVLLLYLAVVLQIILHEGGHLVFGLMTGYKFVSFNVFGFVWSRGADGKMRVGRVQVGGAAGQCLLEPPAYDEGRFPVTLYNMGGVLMNLLTAAVCGALAVPAYHIAPLYLFLVMMALVGVLFALTNGVPLTTAAIQNDGKNQVCVRRSIHAKRALWLQLTIAAEMARGTSLKDMPEEWFAAFPEEAMENPLVTTIAVFRCNRLMDALDLPAAEAAIRTLAKRETGVLPLYRMLLHCDGAVCELLAGRKGDMVQALADKNEQQLMKSMRANPTVLRTRYALALLADGDEAKAAKYLAAFEKAAKKHPFPQDIVMERALLSRIGQAKEAQA